MSLVHVMLSELIKDVLEKRLASMTYLVDCKTCGNPTKQIKKHNGDCYKCFKKRGQK